MPPRVTSRASRRLPAQDSSEASLGPPRGSARHKQPQRAIGPSGRIQHYFRRDDVRQHRRMPGDESPDPPRRNDRGDDYELTGAGSSPVAQLSGRWSPSGSCVVASPWAASSCACVRPTASVRSAPSSQAPDRSAPLSRAPARTRSRDSRPDQDAQLIRLGVLSRQAVRRTMGFASLGLLGLLGLAGSSWWSGECCRRMRPSGTSQPGPAPRPRPTPG